MVTLGNGATQAVQTQISSLGSNLLMVRWDSARARRGGGPGTQQFKLADATAIQRADRGSPSGARGRAAVTVVGNGRNWATNVVAAPMTGSQSAIGSWPPTHVFRRGANRRRGRVHPRRVGAARDLRRHAVGQTGLGQQLRIKHSLATWSACWRPRARVHGQRPGRHRVVPLNTLQRRVTGNRTVPTLLISMEDGSDSARSSQPAANSCASAASCRGATTTLQHPGHAADAEALSGTTRS